MRPDVKVIGDAIRAAVDAAVSARLADLEQQVQKGLAEIQGVEQRMIQIVLDKTGRWDAVESMLESVTEQLQGMAAQHAEAIAEIGRAVAAIPAGRDGVDGRDGIDGKDGQDGRDALELDILDPIDPQRSYPRGTVAVYQGGLIKAERRTGPITGSLAAAGWRVILRGVAGTEVEPSDDLRTLSIRVTHTDGEVVERTLRSPSLLYRGVFRDGDQYDGGDAVTYGGSLWVALRATTTKPGDGSPDWRLAVKKGRDGRDAK
jgi:hypothetical protein